MNSSLQIFDYSIFVYNFIFLKKMLTKGVAKNFNDLGNVIENQAQKHRLTDK